MKELNLETYKKACEERRAKIPWPWPKANDYISFNGKIDCRFTREELNKLTAGECGGSTEVS